MGGAGSRQQVDFPQTYSRARPSEATVAVRPNRVEERIKSTAERAKYIWSFVERTFDN
jgi:hypothetical protein